MMSLYHKILFFLVRTLVANTASGFYFIRNLIVNYYNLYLKICMFVDVLCSLSVQDELGLVGNPDYVVFHGVAD